MKIMIATALILSIVSNVAWAQTPAQDRPGSNLVVSIRSVPQPQVSVSVRDISHWHLRKVAGKWFMVSESGEEKPVSMGAPVNMPYPSPVVTEHASGVLLGSQDLLVEGAAYHRVVVEVAYDADSESRSITNIFWQLENEKKTATKK